MCSYTPSHTGIFKIIYQSNFLSFKPAKPHLFLCSIHWSIYSSDIRGEYMQVTEVQDLIILAFLAGKLNSDSYL